MMAPAMAEEPVAERAAADKAPAAVPAKPGEYWLGIGCSAMPPALRAQLDLPEKQGVLVEGVVPGSPAAKAGILRNDVLMRVGDKLVTEPHDLIEVIEATKEGVLKIELLRGGESKTVEATPTKRPENARQYVGPAPTPGDREAMEKWMQGMWSGNDGNVDGQRPPVRFRFIHPGAIVPHDVLVPVPLPTGMSVTITRKGDQPAKIVVQRGDDKWDLTEKDLDKLPADVRPHVERMLGFGSLGIVGSLQSLDSLPGGMSPDASVRGREMGGMPNALFDRMEQRFDEMNRRMDKMMQQMDKLYEGQAHDEAVEKPAEEHQEK